MPLPYVSAAFVAKTLPLSCASSVFVAKTVPFLADFQAIGQSLSGRTFSEKHGVRVPTSHINWSCGWKLYEGSM